MPTHIGRSRGPLPAPEGRDTLLDRLLQPGEKRTPTTGKRRAVAPRTPADLGPFWALALKEGDKRDKKPGA